MTPIYLSMTSIYERQDRLLITLSSLLKQNIIFDKIFLYLSEEPYLLDSGFTNRKITNDKLTSLLNANKDLIQVKWVENTGPFRKLLPLLKEKWMEDCIIITCDDDCFYTKSLIKNLVSDYTIHKCCVNYRGHYLKKDMCLELEKFNNTIEEVNGKKSIYNFPTGKGCILYKPEFFYKTKDIIFDNSFYSKYCPTDDDLWFFIMRTINNVPCYMNNNVRYCDKDLYGTGLFEVYNNKQNRELNTKNILKLLVPLDS